VTRPLYAIGRYAAGHGWVVLGAWVLVAVALAVTTSIIGKPTDDDLTIPGSDSTRATNLLEDKLPQQANGTVPIAMEATSGTLDAGANRTAVEETVKAYKRSADVNTVVSPLTDSGSDQLSKDGRFGYISLTLDLSPTELDQGDADDLIDLSEPAKRAGIHVAAGGYLGQEVSKPATESSEAIGIAVAIVVLCFAFGTLAAMPLPILTAVFSLSVGLSLIGLLGHVLSIPSIAATLGTMLGLGVGIDYALFIVTRHRELLARGFDVEESVARAAGSSGGAVLFAGSTVIVALLSLYVSGIPIVRSMGYSAAIVVAVSVTGALTLLPAALGLLGERINSLKLPFGGHKADDRPHGWARWAREVGKRPLPAATLGVIILLGLAIPLLDITLGQPDNAQLPEDTQSRQSYDILTEGFGPGTNGPMLVSVKLDPPAKPDTKKLHQEQQQQEKQQQQAQQKYEQQMEAYQEQAQQAAAAGEPPPPQPKPPKGPTKKQQQEQKQQEQFLKSDASDPRLTKLRNQISKDPDVADVSYPDVNKAGTAAVFNATPNSSPVSENTVDLVNRMRDDIVPSALGYPSETKAFVGGSTAAYIDLADKIGDKLPEVIAIVVGLSFLLLTIAFRSIVVPLTAGLMNLISVAAAYGVLVAVFEKGFGLSLIGLDHTIPIVSYVPLLMFAILFGLSMDYQVFLLTRIHEHFKEGESNHDAVVDGLAGTARVITSAAMIMVAVFTSFVLNGDPTVKQFGIGLAVAVAIDATVVRCLLVPAVMVLLGRANWWFPDWAERHLPHLGIEGEEYFEELDRKRGTQAKA
jgi:RND superfamily putative drug exporter